ncbi:unnamed protein product [Ascophyllum nodosum]
MERYLLGSRGAGTSLAIDDQADLEGRLSSHGPYGEEGVAAGRDPLREANRIHCKQTRERRKQREELLREEVEVLTLCKAIVDSGPDLFSLHRVDERAPFSFLCKNFYQRLQVEPEDILGQPLASVVDPRDRHALALTLGQVLGNRDQAYGQGGRGQVPGMNGSLVHLRLTSHGVTCPASMTLVIGTQGLVVVTRLYPSEST